MDNESFSIASPLGSSELSVTNARKRFANDGPHELATKTDLMNPFIGFECREAWGMSRLRQDRKYTVWSVVETDASVSFNAPWRPSRIIAAFWVKTFG
jgi:hypothetical protein